MLHPEILVRQCPVGSRQLVQSNIKCLLSGGIGAQLFESAMPLRGVVDESTFFLFVALGSLMKCLDSALVRRHVLQSQEVLLLLDATDLCRMRLFASPKLGVLSAEPFHLTLHIFPRGVLSGGAVNG